MTGPEEVVDDDALYVLTAVLLTPAQFPSVLGDDFPAACAALGLDAYADGYGLVLGQDSGGARWTVVIDDVSLVAVAIASWDCGMDYDLSPHERTVVSALPGWPLALAVAAPGLPEPHDPAPGECDGRTPLAPPDSADWGPAQRRLGADEIALQWAEWRRQIADEVALPQAGSPGGDGGQDVHDEPGQPHPGLRRALESARAYVESPPPVGRIRSGFAPGGARTLRADGPGWSMVARTDDIAFFLLDEEPGEVLPLGRGPELPGLLEALDAMAVRPY
ncbi:hypothetical protein ACIBCM_31330 [Streptomyces sp. NPDC051018]|uniref:hypothetical protein n=1 Tax=Streptomyces sp. NPDC051018 TaxID=3365639 RepID=UPI003797E595